MYVINPDGTVSKTTPKPYKSPIGDPRKPRAIPTPANTNTPHVPKGNWARPPVGNPMGKALSRLIPYAGTALLAYDIYNLYNNWYTPSQRVPNPNGKFRLPDGHNWRKVPWSQDVPEGEWINDWSWGGADRRLGSSEINGEWSGIDYFSSRYLSSVSSEIGFWNFLPEPSLGLDIVGVSGYSFSDVVYKPAYRHLQEPDLPYTEPDYVPEEFPVPDAPLFPQIPPLPWQSPNEWPPLAPTPNPNMPRRTAPDPLPLHPPVTPPTVPLWPFPSPTPNPNPVPQPFPQPRPLPRPDGKPDPNPPVNPNPVPVPKPDPIPMPPNPPTGGTRWPDGRVPVLETELAPDKSPHPYPNWHENVPPESGEKERKRRLPPSKVLALGQGIMKTFGKYTEADDFIKAIYKALPWQIRRWRGRDGIWRDRHWTTDQRAGAIFQYNHLLNVAEAINNYMIDQANDSVIGKYGNMQSKQYGKVGTGLTGAHQGERQKQQVWDDVEKKWKRSQPLPVREYKRWVKSPEGNKWRLITDHRPARTIPWLRTKNDKGYTRYRKYDPK